MPTNVAPTVANPIPDQDLTVDIPFTYIIPGTTFEDADPGDVLSYAATLDDDSPLPSWLTFTASTLTFSATPPPPATRAIST